MSTSSQTFVHYNKLGGQNGAVRAFSLAPEEWLLCFNMRPFEGELRQLPLKKVRQYTIPYSGRTMLELVNIPNRAGNVLIGLTEDKVKRVDRNSATNLKEAGIELTLNRSAGRYLRWAKTVFNNNLFFCNELNRVHYTDGATVTSIGGECPKGRHVELWFDHLVVGGPIFNSGEDLYNGVAWSHLEEWGSFSPDTDKEGDRYVFTEYQRDYDVEPGVTGVRKLGNACIVYTASCIYQMRYVGLPRVVRVDPVVQDIGNGFPHSLVSSSSRHYFIDSIGQNFVCFNGMGAELIGTKIAKFFFSDISTNRELAQRTWGYVDHKYREIWWVYVSGASEGPFDRAVVYNYVTKCWFTASVEDVHCFTTILEEGSLTCDQLTGTCDQLQGSCDLLGGASGGQSRLWGGANERILQEEQASDITTNLLSQAPPVLEDGDEVYSGIQQVKETDKVAIQAKMDSGSVLQVEIAARSNVDDPAVFDRVALWEQKNETIPTFDKKSGRVLRWRFRPIERTATKILIFETGVPAFSLRVEMLNTVPAIEGFYLSVVDHNPWSECNTVINSGLVNNTLLLDSLPVRFERTGGPFTGAIDAGGRKEIFRIFFDQAFLDLDTVSPGTELSNGVAITFNRTAYHLVDGVCTANVATDMSISYLNLLLTLLSQVSLHTGSVSDPFVFTFSDS